MKVSRICDKCLRTFDNDDCYSIAIRKIGEDRRVPWVTLHLHDYCAASVDLMELVKKVKEKK